MHSQSCWEWHTIPSPLPSYQIMNGVHYLHKNICESETAHSFILNSQNVFKLRYLSNAPAWICRVDTSVTTQIIDLGVHDNLAIIVLQFWNHDHIDIDLAVHTYIVGLQYSVHNQPGIWRRLNYTVASMALRQSFGALAPESSVLSYVGRRGAIAAAVHFHSRSYSLSNHLPNPSHKFSKRYKLRMVM